MTISSHQEPDGMEPETAKVPLWIVLVLVPVALVCGGFVWSMLFAILEVLQ